MIKNKSVHKLDSSNYQDICREIKVKCKVQNKTYIFNYSRNWKDVTCRKCLDKLSPNKREYYQYRGE